MEKQQADCILIGGSSKGPVHVGALKEFTNYFDIKRIAGSSAGSLWGGMMATGMSLEEIEEFTLETNFKDLVKIRAIDYLSSYFKMHLVSTDKLVKFLESTYRGKTMSECDIPFHVFVTNASKKRLELIGPENYPDMKVSEAVKISVSIPGVFEIHEMNGDYYWDGGMGPVISLDIHDIRR
jgi:NTE family protein